MLRRHCLGLGLGLALLTATGRADVPETQTFTLTRVIENATPGPGGEYIGSGVFWVEVNDGKRSWLCDNSTLVTTEKGGITLKALVAYKGHKVRMTFKPSKTNMPLVTTITVAD